MNPLKRASEAFAAKAEKLQADVADFVLNWLGEPVTIEPPVCENCGYEECECEAWPEDRLGSDYGIPFAEAAR